MDFLQYIAVQDDDNRRFDRFLRKYLPDNSLQQIYKFIRTGYIKVNGKKQTNDYRIRKGDILNLPVIKKSTTKKTDLFIQPEILFINDKLIIINKPYDIPVQASNNEQISIDTVMKKLYPSEDSIVFRIGALHRLDRKTTGVLVFSHNLEGARLFTELMKEHKLTKEYLAIIEGKLTTYTDWTDYISKKEDTNQSFHTVNIYTNNNDSCKKAITHVFPLNTFKISEKDYSFVKFVIDTGRTHQIRSQSSFHGFPLVNDRAYGAQKNIINGQLFLHSWKIKFSSDNKDIALLNLPKEIIAPLPKTFSSFLVKYLPGIDLTLYNEKPI